MFKAPSNTLSALTRQQAAANSNSSVPTNSAIKTENSESEQPSDQTASITDSVQQRQRRKMTEKSNIGHPGYFNGSPKEDPVKFHNNFNIFARVKSYENDRKLAAFPALLQGSAKLWYESLPQDTRDSFDTLSTAFKARYQQTDTVRWGEALQIWTMKQAQNESALDFIAKIKEKANIVKLPDEQIVHACLNGFRPHIKSYCMQREAKTTTDLEKHCIIAEAAHEPPEVDNSILSAIASLRTELMQVNAVHTSSESTQDRPRTNQAECKCGAGSVLPTQPRQRQFQQQSACPNCGYTHRNGQQCPAKDKTCHYCGKTGHLQSVCRSAARDQSRSANPGRTQPTRPYAAQQRQQRQPQRPQGYGYRQQPQQVNFLQPEVHPDMQNQLATQ